MRNKPNDMRSEEVLRKHKTTDKEIKNQQVMSPGRIFWIRFRRNKLAITGTVVLLILASLSIMAPWIAPHDPNTTNVRYREKPPSAEHPLGTDTLGRDVLSRLLYGGRISMTVGVVAVAISLSIGILLGSLAGYYRGWVDTVIMRFTDIVISFPFLIIAITIAAILGPNFRNTVIIIGLLSWTGTARLVRGEFLSIRERDYVEAAHAIGAGEGRIIFRHILPNAMAPIIVSATLGMASAVLMEAYLSFLGLGVQQPIPSWGNMLVAAESLKALQYQWWLWVPPGTAIFITVLSINLVGDGLRDALDPRLKD